MRDQHDSAIELLKLLLKPNDGGNIQVIRRLV